MQILHETEESMSPSILRAVYEIRGESVLEKWVLIFDSLIHLYLIITYLSIENMNLILMFNTQWYKKWN